MKRTPHLFVVHDSANIRVGNLGRRFNPCQHFSIDPLLEPRLLLNRRPRCRSLGADLNLAKLRARGGNYRTSSSARVLHYIIDFIHLNIYKYICYKQ